mmetsp:Transcript_59409/g.165923  ORF Transcript_59409/g.165923 Transcript_59409/m.165923 type:complete len:286 (+) Transcript_59409:1591-2448(+)
MVSAKFIHVRRCFVLGLLYVSQRGFSRLCRELVQPVASIVHVLHYPANVVVLTLLHICGLLEHLLQFFLVVFLQDFAVFLGILARLFDRGVDFLPLLESLLGNFFHALPEPYDEILLQCFPIFVHIHLQVLNRLVQLLYRGRLEVAHHALQTLPTSNDFFLEVQKCWDELLVETRHGRVGVRVALCLHPAVDLGHCAFIRDHPILDGLDGDLKPLLSGTHQFRPLLLEFVKPLDDRLLEFLDVIECRVDGFAAPHAFRHAGPARRDRSRLPPLSLGNGRIRATEA